MILLIVYILRTLITHIPPREVRSQAVIDSRLTSRLVLTLASPLRMLQMSLVCP